MKINNHTTLANTLRKVIVLAILAANIGCFANTPHLFMSNSNKEKPGVFLRERINKEEMTKGVKSTFRFINPFKKDILPSTYIKLVLKNKKGSYLSIKIGYIS